VGLVKARARALPAHLRRVSGISPIILGLAYGVVEYFLISSSPLSPVFISPFPGYLYRVIYGLVLFAPFASRNYWRWFARGALAMSVEDASYWAFYFWRTGGLPLQWAWYYPVWNSIPLLYLSLPFITFSYLKGRQLKSGGLIKPDNRILG
jgi:hypothetical protein